MGRSATADLVFGIDLGHEDDAILPWHADDEDDDDEDIDFAEYYAAKLGVAAPTVEYGPDTENEYHAYWDAKRKAIEASGVDIFSYGYGLGGSVLAVGAATLPGEDWGSVPIDPADMTVKPEWLEQLARAVEVLGLTEDHAPHGLKPRWYMTATYN